MRQSRWVDQGGQGPPCLGGLCARSSIRRWGLGSRLARASVCVLRNQFLPFPPLPAPRDILLMGPRLFLRDLIHPDLSLHAWLLGSCPRASDSREKADGRLTVPFKKGDLYGERRMSGNSGLCAEFL